MTTSDILSGVHATVQDGKFTGQAAKVDKATAEVEKANKAGGTLGKDAFLTLLVTQMKYQDPLEPQDNSQMVSQLATFSSLEEMQNMSQSMDRTRASALIGQVVSIDHKQETGNIKNVEGVVDYVSFQGNKTMVSIDGTLYPIEEITAVVDPEYTVATKLAAAFEVQLAKLPPLDHLTKENLSEVEDIIKAYSTMDAYQRSMISKDGLNLYGAYAKWYSENRPATEEEANE